LKSLLKYVAKAGEVCGLANSDPQQFNEGKQEDVEESAQRDKKGERYGLVIIITSGQSNSTKSRIVAAYRCFNRIRQMAPVCTPI